MNRSLLLLGLGALGSSVALGACATNDDIAKVAGGSVSGAGGNGATTSSSSTGNLGGGGGCGVCLTAIPRPIAPLSTSRVTSRRPTLHWELDAGVTSATVDLCLDRACTKPIGAPVEVTGTSYTPASDLPFADEKQNLSTVIYWRLHPGGLTSIASPTWEFTVGAKSAPVDTSWGTTLDVNGDGYADIAVGAPGAASLKGSVYVYLGSALGISALVGATLVGTENQGGFGSSVASAGDVNGDGYADLVVGAASVSGDTGSASIYLGSANGLTTTAALTLAAVDPSSLFGASVASAGDLNGDGYADILVGAPDDNVTGRAYVYLGSATGISATPAATLSSPYLGKGYFATSLASLGDVNGDGYADFIVGAPAQSDSAPARAYVYLGGGSGIPTAPAISLVGPDGPLGKFGYSVASAGDMNGDGYADVVVGAYGVSADTGKVYVYFGSESGPASAPTATLDAPSSGGDFGFSVASAGDMNGDGYSDLAVGAPATSGSAGAVYVYLGSANDVPKAPEVSFLETESTNKSLGEVVASAGDVNGDGYADLIEGAPGETGEPGAFYVDQGAPGTEVDSGGFALAGPGPNSNFGISVCGASN